MVRRVNKQSGLNALIFGYQRVKRSRTRHFPIYQITALLH